ncbi:polysaccharide deacetylase family protein [Aminipila luticellarii]|uniref:Polysaccharide deacetylase n=1 Tax=Aminipila luticellarii TaxID=2507160 RepID=A0A410PUU3_9FIRM|nr:polysaccharide deacetylase family protein [Aminipila luticellarii]QAT42695.1 polysaccharide deacetylase [Aminipila luticellarii]
MRFHKFIWPAIWSSLTICIVILSVSILCKLYVSPPSVGNSTSISVKEKASDSDKIDLPIIMYHGLVKDKKLQNQYFISPDLFENDLKYLKENGYSTITMSELIDYVYNGAPLPEKPVILTFDDGFYNNYLYAFPLLKEYNEKAVISILGCETDRYSLIKVNNAYYSYLTWNQINEMILSGHVEIQNHTYDMHTYDHGRKGCSEKSGEALEIYKENFEDDIGRLQQEIIDYTGTTPNTIVYPFGYYTEKSESLIKEMGFKASLTCSQKVNKISRDPQCLYQLGRFLRPPGKSSSNFFKNILEN